MKRREFLFAAGVLASGLCRPALSQSRPGEKRVGIILPASSGDREYEDWIAAFIDTLRQLGWDENNVRIDLVWATADAASIRKKAVELVGRSPDVILSAGSSTVGPVLQVTKSLPIVFPTAVDPVGAGFIESLRHPGGNATGFLLYEYGLSVKWFEILREVTPNLARVAVARDATTPSGSGQFGAVQAVANSSGLDVQPINLRDEAEIDRDIGKFGQAPNGGLIVTGSGPAVAFHATIIRSANRHKIPTVYYERFFARSGGLISYGADRIDQYRRAAGYVDRILRGERAGDLPVQSPTKYELIVNLKTAREIGLVLPSALLARADEIIE
jgi:putative ABC transport system substrate-binding protein